MINQLENRPNFIDYAKVIGIVLVVMGHYAWFSGNDYQADDVTWIVAHLVTLFHMPLFFIISGILYKRVPVRQEFAKSWRGLVVPYLLFSIVGLLVFAITAEGEGLLRYLLSVVTLGDNYGYGCSLLTTPLWYCGALAQIRCMESILVRPFLRLGAALVGLALMHCGDVLPMRLDSMAVGYIFFEMGVVARKEFLSINGVSVKRRLQLLVASVVVLAVFGVFVIDYSRTPNFSINAMRFGKYPALFLLSGLVGTLMMLAVSSFCTAKSKMVHVISSGTIVILALHQLLLTTFPRLLHRPNFVGLSVATVVCLITCYGVIIVASWLAPALIGGRKIS